MSQELRNFGSSRSVHCVTYYWGPFRPLSGPRFWPTTLLHLVYGQKFLSAAPVLALHIFSLIPFSMVYFLAIVLIVTDNQRVDLGINVLAALINIGLNFALIPYFAEIGAVLAVLITIIIFNQLQNWYIKQRLFPIPLLELTPKILLAAGIMGIVTFLLREWNLAAKYIYIRRGLRIARCSV